MVSAGDRRSVSMGGRRELRLAPRWFAAEARRPLGWVRSLRLGLAALLAAAALAALALAFAPGAGAVSLSLDVSFSATGQISVTLPDGTPVGSTSGAPTVIPAGFYTVVLSAPGGCTELPYFDLEGARQRHPRQYGRR